MILIIVPIGLALGYTAHTTTNVIRAAKLKSRRAPPKNAVNYYTALYFIFIWLPFSVRITLWLPIFSAKILKRDQFPFPRVTPYA